jgi:Flp pilus assembly protein TadG
MMPKLDQRGSAAFEFGIVGAMFFITVFVIFDLGRYAITMQSLRALANAGARAIMIGDTGNACYTDAMINRTTPTCSGDPLSDTQKQAIAPFLYSGGLTPTVNIPSTTTSPLVVTASQPNFTMLLPALWGTTFSAPSASTSVPF